MKKLLALALVIFGFSAITFAQGPVSAKASASATIVGAMTITNAGDLNFGNIIATGPGTVTVATNGTPTYTTGAAAYAIPGTITAAHFDVTGSPNAAYSISTIADITVASGSDVMTVNTFVTDPALLLGKLDPSGKQKINVGATLNLATTPVAGFYTNTTGFTVTVNYN